MPNFVHKIAHAGYACVCELSERGGVDRKGSCAGSFQARIAAIEAS